MWPPVYPLTPVTATGPSAAVIAGIWEVWSCGAHARKGLKALRFGELSLWDRLRSSAKKSCQPRPVCRTFTGVAERFGTADSL